jgi:hypothetical protein
MKNDRAPGHDDAERVPALGFVVGAEARRLLSDEQLQADPVLTAAGWTRRFIADAQRVREATALYERLGFEVRAEALTSGDVADECNDCQLVLLGFRTIYTRPPRAGLQEQSEET